MVALAVADSEAAKLLKESIKVMRESGTIEEMSRSMAM
jgi:hypothetical protein